MDLTAYQEKYSDIITGIQPWQSPDGQPDLSRQSVLTNGMGRLIRVNNQMCETTLSKDGQVGLDPDFKMEDRLMNGRVSVKAKSDKRPSKKTIEFYEVKDIRVDEIIVSDIFQMRVTGVKRDVVVRYANIMKDNDPDGWTAFPEILIMKDIGSLKYYVIGGFHRLAAIKENGYETINAICFNGDRQLGIIKAANENSDRSQRRNHEDIKHVCRTLIELCPDWTFGQLAKWGGVDRNTIERHYKEMEAEGIAPDRPDQLRYITRHGTEATRKGTRDTKPRDEYADISTDDADKSVSDIERQNSFDFTQAKCDEAIQTYQDKQASLGLADLDWYHRDGFFDYARAEMEKQGKTLGYPSHTDSIARLSELAEIWESVTNAIKHNANWVQAIVRKVEGAREADIENETRTALLDEIMKLQIHQVSPLLPEQYRDEWKESKAGLKAAYPLYFSYSNRNNLPIETLEEMKGTLLRMKADLQKTGITPFLSDEFKERAAVHRELTHAWHKAQNAFKVHPIAEHMEFGDFEQEVEFHLELEEGLLDPDSVGGLEVQDLRRYKHLWDKIAKGLLERNVQWVQTILGECTEQKARVEATQSAQSAMDAAKESFLENREALGLAGVSWEDFEKRAIKEFKRRADTLSSPSDQLTWDPVTPPAKLCYLASLWERLRKLTTPPAQDWVAEYVGEVKSLSDSKAEEQIDASEEDTALHNERALCGGHIAAAEHDFEQLKEKHGLQVDFQDFYVYACEHFEKQKNLDLSRYIDGIRSVERVSELLEMWKGIVADIGAEADWIQEFVERFKATEPEEPTPIQIEPLGPADSTPPNANNAQMEVAAGEERPPINFKNLGGGTQGNIRNLARASKTLLEEEDLPDYFKAILSNLFDTIVNFAGADSDELLQKMLEKS